MPHLAPTSLVPEQNNSSAYCCSRQANPKRNDLSARHWHNRYTAWQTRERRQREEREALLAEQKRIFGGETEEDVDEDGLCSNMLEYFIGLDFIMQTEGGDEKP